MPSTDHISRHFIGAVPDEWQLYSDNASDYTIGAHIGFGASSIVYQAEFRPPDATHPVKCALKVLDLDRLPQHSLQLLQRETQLMSLSKHPNVLRVRGTWMTGHKLYIALRLMNAGSAADVMHYGWPGGMEEEVVKCILKQALEGLNYLHINDFIHRDVKAANFLIDDDGTVLLGDLGVAAFLGGNDNMTTQNSTTTSSSTPRPAPGVLGKRKSFVGTPCWMAPEVINRKQYDASADVWSFGITALELAQGRAPRSREPPHSVLLHIVTNSPPTLDREAGPHKYSRAFQEIIDRCLNKDPSKRPTAAELLQTPFFKGVKKKGYLVGTILKGLPPLAQRQERRKQASIISPRTLDSWDFSGTSPTTSLYGPLAVSLRPLRHPTDTTLFSDGVVELDSDEEAKRRDAKQGTNASENMGRAEGAAADAERVRGHRITSQHAPRPHSAGRSRDRGSIHSHSRGVSWASHEPAAVAVAVPVLTKEPLGSALEKELSHAHTTSGATSSRYEPTKDFVAPEQRLKRAEPVPVPNKIPSSQSGETNASPISSSPSGKLWRRLIGRSDDSNPEAGGDRIRKRVFSGVLGGKRATAGTSSSPGSD